MQRLMNDNVILDTDLAKTETTIVKAGRENILYLSSKDRYYLCEEFINTDGSSGHVFKYLTDAEAARWLISNDFFLPQNLLQYEPTIE